MLEGVPVTAYGNDAPAAGRLVTIGQAVSVSAAAEIETPPPIVASLPAIAASLP